MRLLLLSVGDGESWDSWSGSTKSLVDHLRRSGHSVICRNVDLQGFTKWQTALSTFTPDRRRWWVRYQLGSRGFAARSRRAQAAVDNAALEFDAVLQIGATFEVAAPEGVPLALYCDSNIELARTGAEAGVSDASVLSDSRLNEIRGREGSVYLAADHIFSMSHRLRRSFIDDFQVPESRVQTVHPGPNFPIGKEPEVPERSVAGDPVVLFIGRDFERKGGMLLLEAFSQVRSTLPKAQLLLVGPDELPLPPEDPRKVGVRLLGFLNKNTREGQEEIYSAYAQARVFCLPTRFEPFGIVFLEAMHFKLPCVGPDAWAVPEIIQKDTTGLLFEPNNAQDLGVALLTLLRDPQRAVLMGEAGKRRLGREFSWSLAADRIATGLRQLSDRFASPG